MGVEKTETCMVCHAVTSQTSSIATTVSRNSSNPSLWWGVVNLGQYNNITFWETKKPANRSTVRKPYITVVYAGIVPKNKHIQGEIAR